MQPNLLETDGLVIDRKDSGESYLRFRLLSAEHGLITCMQRRSKKPGPNSIQADLFDYSQTTLERRQQTGAWFLREYHVIRRHSGLAINYKALKEASSWARLLLANAGHMEECRGLVESTLEALQAWEHGHNAEAVHLKLIYRFARNEGLPVKEQWWRALSKADQDLAAGIIGKPVAEAPEISAAHLLVDLRRWVTTEHHFQA